MQDFSGRSALVTGAASGIGRAVAERLDAGGARVIGVDLTVSDVGDGVIGDVRDEALWDGLAERLAGIDHAVINAGVAGAGRIDDLTFAEWRRILSVNLDGAFLSLRAALRGVRDGGSIVVVSSAAGIKAEQGVAAYGAAKAGVIQLARVAAKEAAARRVRVNVIAPAGVETPVWDAVPMFAERAAAVGRDAAFAELAAMATPLGRYAKAEEIAGQVAFLLSDAAATITGAVLTSDGGYLL